SPTKTWDSVTTSRLTVPSTARSETTTVAFLGMQAPSPPPAPPSPPSLPPPPSPLQPRRKTAASSPPNVLILDAPSPPPEGPATTAQPARPGCGAGSRLPYQDFHSSSSTVPAFTSSKTGSHQNASSSIVPQQITSPSSVSPQVDRKVKASCRKRWSPGTSTGSADESTSSFASWPCRLSPQHHVEPSAARPQ